MKKSNLFDEEEGNEDHSAPTSLKVNEGFKSRYEYNERWKAIERGEAKYGKDALKE